MLIVKDLMTKEYERKDSRIVWSETLETRSGARIAMLNMDSHLKDEGYPYVAVIDFGSEVAMETYNERGEWNEGVDHPLNIVVKVDD